jgi:hypothetical protein
VESFDGGGRSNLSVRGLTTYVGCGEWNALATDAPKLPEIDDRWQEIEFRDAGVTWTGGLELSTFAPVARNTPAAMAVLIAVSPRFDRLERNAVAACPVGYSSSGKGRVVDYSSAATHLAETRLRLLRSRKPLLGRYVWYVEAVRNYGGNAPLGGFGQTMSVYRAWFCECTADASEARDITAPPDGPLSFVDEVCSLEDQPWHWEYPHRPYAAIASGDELFVLVEEIALDWMAYRLKRIGEGRVRTVVTKEVGGC